MTDATKHEGRLLTIAGDKDSPQVTLGGLATQVIRHDDGSLAVVNSATHLSIVADYSRSVTQQIIEQATSRGILI